MGISWVMLQANFYRVVKHIPDGSDVILLFGEIDCREGILLAVEKGRCVCNNM